MRRYYFYLVDDKYNEYPCLINDGSSKQTAINASRRYMAANNIKSATLVVNSMITSNILDMIDINLNN